MTKTTKTTALRERAQRLAEQTADAYSWDNYGEKRWLAAAHMLLKRGYTERQAEAILRSKWTRWAGDMATNRGRRYGQVNSADLARFLDTMPADQRAVDVHELVVGTFGFDPDADTEQALAEAEAARLVRCATCQRTRWSTGEGRCLDGCDDD